jgi:nicotinate phosphoribosyltransferase
VLYKLVEVERDGAVRNAAKFSAAKVTYPGRKQVYREVDSSGHYVGDVIAGEDEHAPTGEPLLAPVMRAGVRLAPDSSHDPPPLAEAQKRCRAQIERLPAGMRGLAPAAKYPVRHSARLEQLLQQVRDRVTSV